MPTLIGAVFFCWAVYCFFLKQDGLLGLLIVAGVFQAASAINIAERGIQPYYVVAVFVIARGFVNRFCDATPEPMPQGGWLWTYGLIAVGSAVVLPFLFAGIPVYDPKIGIDDGFLIRPPLSFGLNNVAQAAFLIFHIATVYAVLSLRVSYRQVRWAYEFAFYLVVAIIAVQSVCQLTGIPFPHSLILNNPGYSLWTAEGEVGGTRNPGSFSEPSFAGGFLAMCCIGFIAEYLVGKKGGRNAIVALIASALVASGGSLLTLYLFAVALAIRYFPFRFPWFVDIGRARRLLWLSFLLAVPAVLAALGSSGFAQALVVNTASKGDSLSFINRTASDVYALQLFLLTHWLGVGLGSSRASSLLTTMLSTVGIAGTLAFGIFYFKLFLKLPREYEWLKWAAFALLANMCINIPDMNLPFLWIPIVLAVHFSSTSILVRERGRLHHPASDLALHPSRPPGGF
jgi:hypothetical protein